MTNHQQSSIPLCLCEREAAKLLNLSARTLFGLRQAGRIEFIKLGEGKARVLYPVAGLHRFIEANTEGVAAK
ncbi:MAG: helix-turn-helix domain-containing protein [Tepidisphaeraceae bacterium]